MCSAVDLSAVYVERAARARALSRRRATGQRQKAGAVRSGSAQVMRAHRTRVPCVAAHAFYCERECAQPVAQSVLLL